MRAQIMELTLYIRPINSGVAIKPYGNCSQRAAPRPATSASPENVIEMQILCLLPKLGIWWGWG